MSTWTSPHGTVYTGSDDFISGARNAHAEMSRITVDEYGILAQRDAAAMCANRLIEALRRADKLASKAHDAMWGMNLWQTSAGKFERETWERQRTQASKEIWKLHDLAREALAVAWRQRRSFSQLDSTDYGKGLGRCQQDVSTTPG